MFTFLLSLIAFNRRRTSTFANLPIYYLKNIHGLVALPTGGAAIAQWIRLHLPYLPPGFESQARHLRFFIYSICATFVM